MYGLKTYGEQIHQDVSGYHPHHTWDQTSVSETRSVSIIRIDMTICSRPFVGPSVAESQYVQDYTHVFFRILVGPVLPTYIEQRIDSCVDTTYDPTLGSFQSSFL